RTQRDDPAAAELEAEAFGEAAIKQLVGEAGRIAAADLDAEIAAETPDVLDVGMARFHVAQPFEAARSQLPRSFDEPFLLDDVEGRERRSAGDGALFVGVMAKRRARRAVELLRSEHRGERHDPAAEALA